MFSFHKPKVYRSTSGCCICKAKSSSSRFTDSKKYEEDFVDCFQLEERRAGEVCNACVLLVKRWKKLPPGTQRHWRHVVDARAGPGTKSFVKIKSKKNAKHKIKSKKHIEEEEMDEDSKKAIENDEQNDFAMNDISGDVEADSEPASPRSVEEEEPMEMYVRGHKHINTSPPVSSFLDMTFWKREKVCCGVIFKGPHGQVIVDPRFLKPCVYKRAHAHTHVAAPTTTATNTTAAVATTDASSTKIYSDNSSDSGYDESSNPGEVVQPGPSNN
ncbi:SIN3-HDAC complex-associated factor-like [Macrosteles quadrilineatus]|uniref:SIN3-HDAC complex-associated factor-like n=1 Tax=Macrosteles quadrilineatus TaxID=74068 RepID=UPI0023E2B057|nr:SIN3-HDAC complex-associated factor-like [Macrosteles quadrilineatus]XP_054289588.1 SIN3-HDAC complex-associated factor-like [Macrosteles quadrilineatus]